MENDDPDIYLPSIHEKYAKRPNSLENLTLAEFAANYSVTRAFQHEENSGDEEVDHTDIQRHPKIQLKDNMGTIQKRPQPRVIRYHYISKEKDEELHYNRHLLLYLPWRNESDLKANFSYKTKFEQVKETTTILEKITTYEPFNDEVESILENFDPDDAAPEMWNEMAAQYAQEQEDSKLDSDQIVNPLLDPDSLSTNQQISKKRRNVPHPLRKLHLQ